MRASAEEIRQTKELIVHRRELNQIGEESDWWDSLSDGLLTVSPGSVTYVENVVRDNEPPAPVFNTPIIPTLQGERLDAEEAPGFAVGDNDSGSLWLVCQLAQCSGLTTEDVDEPERIELTARDAEPEIGDGERAIRMFDFDIDDGALADTVSYLGSDWIQQFSCDGDFHSSNDSFWGSDTDSTVDSESGGGSGEDPESDSDSDDGEGCKMGMSAKWLNKVDCFPLKGGFGPGFECVPAAYTFVFKVTFKGVDPYNKSCPHWAYGVSMPGSISGEVVWTDSATKIVQFTWDSAPACAPAFLNWRARGFGPLKGENGKVIPSCCGKMFSGSVPKEPAKMPRVCGCSWCTEHFPDFDPVGWSYRNAGVWSCDRVAAAELMEVMSEPYVVGVMEQHHFNVWLALAVKRGMLLNHLPEIWNSFASQFKAAWFHHLAGRGNKAKKLKKLRDLHLLPGRPAKFMARPSAGRRAICYLWTARRAVWEELRYSLRSVRENFSDHPEIHIFGDERPDFLLDGHGVTFHRAPEYAEALAAALQQADEIILMNDDIYYLRQTSWEEHRTALTRGGNLVKHMKEKLKAASKWLRSVGRATASLYHHGHDYVWDFSTHTPYLFERAKAIETIKLHGLWWKVPFETLYHNQHGTIWRPPRWKPDLHRRDP